MELERLSLLLREAERGGEDEKKKRQEAESKERAAVAQQSSLAKSKHELDLQVAVLKREVEEERRKRAVSENRAIALDKRAADAENMVSSPPPYFHRPLADGRLGETFRRERMKRKWRICACRTEV